jgi:ATP-binding cassette subfamily A (ABC1) protein 3
MYESILKVATNNPDFSFKVRSTPYPPTQQYINRWSTLNASLIVFITSIGYSVSITSIVSYLVVERKSGLKHLQLVSGLQKKAYWSANFLVDFIKLQITTGITIACFFVYGMNIKTAYIIYLVFPFGILPFTYVTSFMFSEDSAAQSFTMFFHFLTVGILSSIVITLRLNPSQELLGDVLNFLLKLIPSYPLSSSVYCDTQCEEISRTRSESGHKGNGMKISSNIWAFENNSSDIVFIFFHLVFWTFILMMIEMGYLKKMTSRCTRK